MDRANIIAEREKAIDARLDLFQRTMDLTEAGKFDEAEKICIELLKRNNDDYLALFNYGALSLLRGKDFAGPDWKRAFEMFERITCEPHDDTLLKAAAMNCFGDLMLKAGSYDKAALCFCRAKQFDSTNAAINANYAWSLMWNLDFKGADQELAEAIRDNPLSVKAKFNRAICLLTLGSLKEGWKEHELRFQVDPENVEFKTSVPKWKGFVRDKRRVLICGEQGYGDSLHFVRYLKMVRATGAEVHWYGHPALNELFRMGLDCKPDKIWEEKPPEDAYDFWCHLLSLPYIFKTRLGNIPDDVPYIRVDGGEFVFSEAAAMLRMPRIGLCWAGSPKHGKDKARSFAPETFQPLIDAFPDCAFYSLQWGPRAHEVERLNGIQDLAPKIETWVDTAHWLNSLDLLISCDTSLVHLAGAMARPVWMMTQYSPDWRWMLERTDSPWYPTLRLFRQDGRKDYAAMVKEQIIPALELWRKLR